MNKPSREYLIELMKDAQEKLDRFSYVESGAPNEMITYVCTKRRNMMGILSGLSGLAEIKKYEVKETCSIGSNCKYYNKFYKSDGRLIKVECFVGGRDDIDVIYIAHYAGNCRYLFPHFSDLSKAVGYYIVATKYENGNVVEEYRVNNGQIVYEKYDYSLQNDVGYYCVNYVPNGKHQILGEEDGIFDKNSLEYRQVSNYAWFQND